MACRVICSGRKKIGAGESALAASRVPQTGLLPVRKDPDRERDAQERAIQIETLANPDLHRRKSI